MSHYTNKINFVNGTSCNAKWDQVDVWLGGPNQNFRVKKISSNEFCSSNSTRFNYVAIPSYMVHTIYLLKAQKCIYTVLFKTKLSFLLTSNYISVTIKLDCVHK